MKKYVADKQSDRLMIVTEQPTGNIMFAGLPRDGRPLVNKLNGGCGFNGYTPSFMFNRFIVSEHQPKQDILVKGVINV
jgi:hypothetical protein